MTQENDPEVGITDILITVGLFGLAAWLYMNDPWGGDNRDDWPDDNDGGGPSSYPPEEDAMNHRYPGSYGSKTGG